MKECDCERLEMIEAAAKAFVIALDEKHELDEKIRRAGRPPHTDFWIQSIETANDKSRAALLKLMSALK